MTLVHLPLLKKLAFILAAVIITALLLPQQSATDPRTATGVTNHQEKQVAASKAKGVTARNSSPVEVPTITPRSATRSNGKSFVEQSHFQNTARRAKEDPQLPDITVADQIPANTEGMAVQLAEDVRLPAALIPETGVISPPEVAAAAVEIGYQFYRDLQMQALENAPSRSNTPESNGPDELGNAVTLAGDDTAVISNGPMVEQARSHADEQFRALYGNERYLQQSIKSALEVLLPPVPGSR